MRRLVLVLGTCALLPLAACGGEDDGGPDAAAGATLAFVAPAPGATFTRDTLDDVGALVAAVPVEVASAGSPARVALSLGGAEVATVDANGAASLVVAQPGAATLTATAYDAAGGVLATAQVAITVADPAIADCKGWLDLYGVGYTVGPTRAGVADPVTAMMPINGVPYRTSSAARTTMFGDCTLIKSLAEAAPSMRRRGIVEVTDLGVYNYRCIGNVGTPPNCPNGVSQHAYGNAIDLAAFKDQDGVVYSVNDDWVIDPDSQETCEAPTEPGKDRFLHELICELKQRRVWNIVLTPNFNAAHRDHFHVDLTAGSNFIERVLGGSEHVAVDSALAGALAAREHDH